MTHIAGDCSLVSHTAALDLSELAAWPAFKLLPPYTPIGQTPPICMRKMRKWQERAVIGSKGRQSFYISMSYASRGHQWPVTTTCVAYGQISSKRNLVNGTPKREKPVVGPRKLSTPNVIQTVIQVCVQSMWSRSVWAKHGMWACYYMVDARNYPVGFIAISMDCFLAVKFLYVRVMYIYTYTYITRLHSGLFQ